jgi:hypothetical protein
MRRQLFSGRRGVPSAFDNGSLSATRRPVKMKGFNDQNSGEREGLPETITD